MESNNDHSTRTPSTFQIQLNNSSSLEAVITNTEYIWSSTKDLLRNIVSVWIEPIMDRRSLINLSIGVLLLEHVSVHIQRYDPKTTTERIILPSPTDRDTGSLDEHDSLLSGGLVFGSPFMAVLGGFALVLSCLANAPHDASFFAPAWFRVILPPHHHGSGISSALLLYVLLLMFCLESILMISILMFGCHAITFPEWLEHDVKILISLMGTWLTSLLASSFLRYYLYYSIGD